MNVFQMTRQVLDQTQKAMAVLDDQGRLQYATPAFYTATAISERTSAGKQLETLCAPSPDREFPVQVFTPSQGPDQWQGELEFLLPDNRQKPCRARISRLESDNSGRAVFLVSLEDPADTRTGTIDPLTGLPKTGIFLDRVDQSIRFSRREQSKIIMFLIRLDRFELLTDGLGHEHSDRIIQEVARRLRQAFRESDTIARISRDTFGLLLKVTKETHASLVAEKVLAKITAPIQIGDRKMVVTASIGIATCHDAGDPAEKIMEFAEAAMHHAAQTGGNAYHFFAKDLNDKARKRIEMENNLRSAVEADQFILHYQPKVDIGTSRIVGAEALIRWEHPEQGMVPPFHFIPVAEETGLIIDIGRWVLNRACSQIRLWQAQGLAVVPVAVNVSSRQFQHPGFFDDVRTAIAGSGLDPELLELEITESMLMSDVDRIIERLSRLSGVGLNLSIDDFGTGYSNLSYLVRFPVSTLKIDRAFVKDVESDPTIAGLTHAIIDMSKTLNLKIVAEGAENKAHIEFLKAHGCHVVQGYYYSKPVPANEFGRLLAAGIIEVPE